jgi:hypothetical protein
MNTRKMYDSKCNTSGGDVVVGAKDISRFTLGPLGDCSSVQEAAPVLVVVAHPNKHISYWQGQGLLDMWQDSQGTLLGRPAQCAPKA